VRRWIALAAYLYPQAWRERYGEEFDALLEDAAADWRQLWNVTYGAFAMQLTHGITYLKVAGGLALAGGVLALAASYRVPPRYVSSAVVRIVPVINDNRPIAKQVLRRAAADGIGMLQGFAMAVITERAAAQVVKWKPGERNRTILDAAQDQQDDVRIRPVELAGEKGVAVRVSFADSDRGKAQAGLTELVKRAREVNEVMNTGNAALWNYLWHQPVPFTEKIEVVDPASLPATPSGPRRSIFLAVGAAGGLLLGVLATLFRRHPGAGLQIAACGLAGFAVAGGLSLLVAERYSATAEMRIAAPNDPENYSGAAAVAPLSEWAERLRKEVVIPRRFVLAGVDGGDGVMQAKTQRATREGVIGISVKGSDTAMPFLEVTFSHPDKSMARFGADRVAMALATQYWNDLIADTPASGPIREARQSRAGERFQVGPFTTTTSTYYRWEIRAAGALAGILLLGCRDLAIGLRRTHPVTA